MPSKECCEKGNISVMVLGVRGIPGVPGGVESHCEQLYPRITSRGGAVRLISRSRFSTTGSDSFWQGVSISPIWSPSGKGAEALIHTLLGVLMAGWVRPDILHIHSIGPGLFTPLAKLLGLKVVVTYHASDYRQEKWGPIGKWVLRAGELMMMRFADSVISVSLHGAQELERLYKRRPVVIGNGVRGMDRRGGTGILHELGLSAGKYVLHVGRAIPDKRQGDLIEAYSRLGLEGWNLVLVGEFPLFDSYSESVRRAAAGVDNVVFAGKRTGAELEELFCSAGCFTMPSSYEGLPIALLEAVSASLPVAASNIEANKEVRLPEWAYFNVGDIDAMAQAMVRVIDARGSALWRELRDRICSEYDWDNVADAVMAEYRHVLNDSKDSQMNRAG